MNKNKTHIASSISYLEKAELLVIQYHGNTKRKLRNQKVVDHLYRVRDAVKLYTDNEVIIAAALLHDIIEDTNYTIEQMSKDMGIEIKSLVMDVTEDKLLPWKERKQKYIDHCRISLDTKDMLNSSFKPNKK